MEREKGVIQQANEVVENELQRELTKAIIRVERIRSGDSACCCPNCTKEAVSDVNSLLMLVVPDEKVYEAFHYEVVSDERGVHIEQGQQFPKEIYDKDSDTGLSNE